MRKKLEPSDFGISEYPLEEPQVEISPILRLVLAVFVIGGPIASIVILLKTHEIWWVFGILGGPMLGGIFFGLVARVGISPARREQTRLFEVDRQSRDRYENSLCAWEMEKEERQLRYWLSLKDERLEVGFAALIRCKGWGVEATQRTGDNGIDLICVKGESIILAQCKGHSKSIGVGVIRDALGVAFVNKGTSVVVVAPIGFTKGSLSLAENHGIRLFDARDCVDIANSLRDF